MLRDYPSTTGAIDRDWLIISNWLKFHLLKQVKTKYNHLKRWMGLILLLAEYYKSSLLILGLRPTHFNTMFPYETIEVLRNKRLILFANLFCELWLSSSFLLLISNLPIIPFTYVHSFYFFWLIFLRARIFQYNLSLEHKHMYTHEVFCLLEIEPILPLISQRRYYKDSMTGGWQLMKVDTSTF